LNIPTITQTDNNEIFRMSLQQFSQSLHLKTNKGTDSSDDYNIPAITSTVEGLKTNKQKKRQM
jgi:hypothetical protein